MINAHEQICIKLSHLEQLEQDRKDLIKAKMLIERLRAENEVLKAEKRNFFSEFDNIKRHICIAGNSHRKYGVTFAKVRMQKLRLI
jgi:hypothetical protein